MRGFEFDISTADLAIAPDDRSMAPVAQVNADNDEKRIAALDRSQRFYRDTLGLAVYRQFGSRDAPGLVLFLGNGLLEVSGRSTDPPGNAMAVWIQVRDVRGEHRRLLQAGVPILREPRQEAWGLVEMWIADPDGLRIVLVEVPDDHPLRRDQRGVATLDD